MGLKNHVISNIRVMLIFGAAPIVAGGTLCELPPSLWAATHTAMPPLTIPPMVRVVCGCPNCMRLPCIRVRHRLPRKLGLRVPGGWVGRLKKKKTRRLTFA